MAEDHEGVKSFHEAGAPPDPRKRSVFRRLSYFWVALLLANLVLAAAFPQWRSWSAVSHGLLAVSGILLGLGVLISSL